LTIINNSILYINETVHIIIRFKGRSEQDGESKKNIKLYFS